MSKNKQSNFVGGSDGWPIFCPPYITGAQFHPEYHRRGHNIFESVTTAQQLRSSVLLVDCVGSGTADIGLVHAFNYANREGASFGTSL